jgi:hypothetical protein
MFERETSNKGEIDALDVVKPISQVDVSARAHVANYAALIHSANPSIPGELEAAGGGQ